MAKKISTQYDMLKIPIIGLVAETKSSAPSSPADGQIYYNTADTRLYTRENGAWVLVSMTGSELLANKDAAGGYAGLTGGKLAIAAIPTGTSGVTVPFGNDARFSDMRVPTDNSVTGGAPGAGVKIAATTIVAGNIVSGTLTDVQVAAANKDGAAGTASMRTLGTSATSACAGNDARLSDMRTPSDASVTSAKIVDGAIVVGDLNAALLDAADATTSLRMLGYTATKAMPGVARLDQIAVPTAPVSMNGQEVTNGGAPTGPNSLARLVDIQTAQAGIDNKPSVRLISTTQRALTGLATIDGVTPTAGDRILLVGNTAPAENGPWLAAAGAWSRPPNETITSGAFWLVTEGSLAGSQWKVATPDPIVLGTTSLSITQWGAGVAMSGTTSRISVIGGVIDIDSAYVGQATITTLGTIATGTWSASTIALNKGGTGSTTAGGARTNLSSTAQALPQKYIATLGALSAGVEATITHNLNTMDTTEAFRIAADDTKTDFAVRNIDVNTIGVTSDVAYGASAIKAVVMG